MKVYMITDTHFGIYLNNLDKWLNMMESTFYNYVIPFLKENSKPGDILIHLGDLFDNRTSIPIIVLNKGEDGEEISEAVTIDEESMDISIKLEYETYIKEFIQKQKYENEGFKNGILNEYDEIIRIYSENYKPKVD